MNLGDILQLVEQEGCPSACEDDKMRQNDKSTGAKEHDYERNLRKALVCTLYELSTTKGGNTPSIPAMVQTAVRLQYRLEIEVLVYLLVSKL